jgi:hypothetical protein
MHRPQVVQASGDCKRHIARYSGPLNWRSDRPAEGGQWRINDDGWRRSTKIMQKLRIWYALVAKNRNLCYKTPATLIHLCSSYSCCTSNKKHPEGQLPWTCRRVPMCILQVTQVVTHKLRTHKWLR